MQTLQNLGGGFVNLADPTLLLLAVAGVVLGMMVGVLPGIGPIGALSVLLGVTTLMGPTGSLVMFAGVYFGAMYGGTTSSILLNVPGESTSVVQAIDGYQMTKKGRGGAALAISAISSFAAGTLALVGLMVFAPWFSTFAVELGPPEYMALAIAGLLLLAALSNGSTAKALTMVCAGLAIGAVGTDPISGTLRFTLGSGELAQGISFVALIMGVFGIAEALSLAIGNQSVKKVRAPKMRELIPSREELRESTMPTARGGVLGFFLGLIPGPAPVIAPFASYVMERKISKTPEKFGKGTAAGVAGPEAANNAGATATFIPLLVLGIPFAPTMALVLAALLLNGIVPGPSFISDQPDMFWTVIAAMWLGNFILLALNLPLIGLFTRLLSIPTRVLVPIIIGLCVIGVYAQNNSIFDVYVLLVAGVIGYLLRLSGFPMAALVLAVILQPTLESSLRQTLVYSSGDPAYLLSRPIALGILTCVMLAIALTVRGAFKRRAQSGSSRHDVGFETVITDNNALSTTVDMSKDQAGQSRQAETDRILPDSEPIDKGDGRGGKS